MEAKRMDWWSHADALAMAVRLHVAGNAPEEIERLLGLTVMDIVDLATRTLLRKCPAMGVHRELMFSPDTQGELVMLVFRAIACGKVSTERPRAMVNLFMKIAQNRLRNIRRNALTRNRRAEMLTESQIGAQVEQVAYSGQVSDLYGRKIQATTNKKTEVPRCQE